MQAITCKCKVSLGKHAVGLIWLTVAQSILAFCYLGASQGKVANRQLKFDPSVTAAASLLAEPMYLMRLAGVGYGQVRIMVHAGVQLFKLPDAHILAAWSARPALPVDYCVCVTSLAVFDVQGTGRHKKSF